MLTILSSPKAFQGIDKINQYNAIHNWKKIKNVQIILYGDETGIDEAANEFNVELVKDVECSRQGIPLFNSIIESAERRSIHSVLMYVNCDILFNEALVDAVNCIQFDKFLLVGERLDLSRGTRMELYEENSNSKILDYIAQDKIELHGPTGVDYFIFPKGIWVGLPKIVIGRGGYDSSLLAHCKRNMIPIIDGTGTIIALHQFHNYNHIQGGKNKVFYGEDALINNNAQGGRYSSNSIADSEYYIENYKLISYNCRGEKLRALELSLRFKYNLSAASIMVKIIRKLFKFGPLAPPNANIRILNS